MLPIYTFLTKQVLYMKLPLRMTPQREIILNELSKNKMHPTADELYDRIKKKLPHISLATVYRNLETLSETGLITKLEVTGRQKRFDWNKEPHSHITCTECNKLDDIFPPALSTPSLDFAPGDNKGYKVIGHRIEYFGICPACQEKLSKKE